MIDATTPQTPDFVAQLREELELAHGPLLGGAKLIAALGHTNIASLRQARKRGRITVPIFRLPKQRGYFALTRDVAIWLAKARISAMATAETFTEKGADHLST